MNENEIAKKVLDAAFAVHTKLGPGLLVSVYEVVLAHELRKAGVFVERTRTGEAAPEMLPPFIRYAVPFLQA